MGEYFVKIPEKVTELEVRDWAARNGIKLSSLSSGNMFIVAGLPESVSWPVDECPEAGCPMRMMTDQGLIGVTYDYHGDSHENYQKYDHVIIHPIL